jgi:hypothetical protein
MEVRYPQAMIHSLSKLIGNQQRDVLNDLKDERMLVCAYKDVGSIRKELFKGQW